jgi:hypothetical protein
MNTHRWAFRIGAGAAVVAATAAAAKPPAASTCSRTVDNEAAIATAVAGARGGTTVCIAGGSYGAMTWTGGTARKGRVTIKPTPGATVTLDGQLTEDASNVTVEGLRLPGQRWVIDGPTSNVTMKNITAAHFWMGSQPRGGVHNITVLGGSYGPNHTYPDNIIGSDGSRAVNTHLLIKGVRFHDQTRTSPAAHFECLQIWNASGIVITNSRFENCSIFSILLLHVGPGDTDFPPPTPTNIRIVNNWFDCCTDDTTGRYTYYKNYGLLFSNQNGERAWRNVTVENNSGDAGLDFGTSPSIHVSYARVRVENNALPLVAVNTVPSGHLPPGVTVKYNAWFQGSAVGFGDIGSTSPSSIFVRWAGGRMPGLDLHERPTSITVGRGDPGSFPPRDIDGHRRVSPPDIGASQIAR